MFLPMFVLSALSSMGLVSPASEGHADRKPIFGGSAVRAIVAALRGDASELAPVQGKSSPASEEPVSMEAFRPQGFTTQVDLPCRDAGDDVPGREVTR